MLALRFMSIRGATVLLLGVVVWVAMGCERSAPEGAAEAAGAGEGGTARVTAARARRTAQAGGVAAQDMVRAVSAGGAGAPVELRFALQGRPAAGQPLELDVALTAVTPVQRLRATFQGGEGFEVRAGHTLGPLEGPQVGEARTHRVTVVPRTDGIFNLSAVVLVEQASGELARTFAIPVIVGEGLAEDTEALERTAGKTP